MLSKPTANSWSESNSASLHQTQGASLEQAAGLQRNQNETRSIGPDNAVLHRLAGLLHSGLALDNDFIEVQVKAEGRSAHHDMRADLLPCGVVQFQLVDDGFQCLDSRINNPTRLPCPTAASDPPETRTRLAHRARPRLTAGSVAHLSDERGGAGCRFRCG